MIKEIFSIMQSVLSAFIGVQKRDKLVKDFSSKSAIPFVISGIILAVAFVLIVIFVVQIVLTTNA